MLGSAVPDRPRIAPRWSPKLPKASSLVVGTDREIKSVRTSARRVDFRVRGAPGLLLRVTPLGTKSWVLLFKSPETGRWSKTLLGRYPALGLADAKSQAQLTMHQVLSGADPNRRGEQPNEFSSFRELAARYSVEHERRNSRANRRSRSTDELERILSHDILPRIGQMRPDLVTRRQVSQIVESIADRGAYVASDRALGVIRAIYNWGCATGRLENDPTIGLKKRNSSRPKIRVLTPWEIGVFWRLIEHLAGMSWQLRDAMRLQLLTGVRISEALGADRREFDLTNQIWTIPAVRTKSYREHQIPISQLVRALFEAAVRRTDSEEEARAQRLGRMPRKSTLLFHSERRLNVIKASTLATRAPRDGAFDPHAGTRCLNRLQPVFQSVGLKTFNTHDLRRTFATQLGEAGVPDQLISELLNHAPQSITRRHYNHAKVLVEKRSALDAWDTKLASIIETAE